MERDYILITGFNGMVGSQLTKRLTEDGYHVLGLSNSDVQLDINNSGYVFEKVDLTDCVSVEKLFEKYKISKIIHLAAIAHVHKGMDDSWNNYYRINTLCSKTIFNCAAEKKIPVFFSSTVDVYGIAKGKVNEDSDVCPIGSYSRSKAVAENLLQDICKESTFCIARFAPVYAEENKIDIYKRCFVKYPVVGYLVGNGKKYDFLSIKLAVDFITKWVKDDTTTNEVFVVSNEKSIDTRELIESEKKKGNANIVLRIPLALADIILGISNIVLGKNSKLCFSINKVLNPIEIDRTKLRNYMIEQGKE